MLIIENEKVHLKTDQQYFWLLHISKQIKCHKKSLQIPGNFTH